jgi:hypothetical protein
MLRWCSALEQFGGVLVIARGCCVVSGQFMRLVQLFNFLPLLG